MFTLGVIIGLVIFVLPVVLFWYTLKLTLLLGLTIGTYIRSISPPSLVNFFSKSYSVLVIPPVLFLIAFLLGSPK